MRVHTWTIEEIGNVEADGIAGDARLGAKKDEEVWDEEVRRWNSKVEELDSMHAVPPKVNIAKKGYIYGAADRGVETANNNAVGAELG
jgi:hypothetical protein